MDGVVFTRAYEDGGWESVTPRFIRRDPVLVSVSYERNWNVRYFERNLMSEEARRRELGRLLVDQPTFWERDADARPAVVDRFFFAPNVAVGNSQIENEVKACFWVWGCVSVRDGVDCRTVVANNRSFLIDGEFRWPSTLYVEATDHALFADELFADAAFASRDLTGQACALPPIH
jgi:hypothetical protein